MTARRRTQPSALLSATGMMVGVALLVVLVLGSHRALAHGEEEHSPGPTHQLESLGSPAAASSPVASVPPVPAPSLPGSPSPLRSLAPGLLQASGIVLSVDSPALGRVDAFLLLTQTGDRLGFDTSELAFDPAFPVSHLAEHQMTADPVRVTYRVDDDRLVVIALADAE